MAKVLNDKIGEVGFNSLGSKMVIEKYNTYTNIVVRFDNGDLVSTTYQNFSNGQVKSLHEKRVYGVGFIGVGKYKSVLNGKNTKQYETWRGMLRRCYDEKYQEKFHTYIGCAVDPIWHNFQNFAEFYDSNYYNIENNKMCLDKDILVKNNKIYSPETCVFVPEFINNLFVKNDPVRGFLPIGVSLDKEKEKYKSSCSNGDKKRKHLGYYDTPEEAFKAYKKYKEALIREKAELYKNLIPVKLYEVMMKYEVEIND